MTLTDAGALIALYNPTDVYHAACVAVTPRLSFPLQTTWPCLSEASYLLRREGGWPLVAALLEAIRTGYIVAHIPDENELRRVRELMLAYRDLPCDLADASLIAAAETLGATQIFTVDSHFYAYRLSNGASLKVLP